MSEQSEVEHPAAKRIREREAAFAAGLTGQTTADAPGADDDGGSRAFRKLREKARKAEALEDENAELRLELALRDSGLKLNDSQRQALLAVHDGEIDAEALKATAESLAFVDPPQVSAEEQAAHQRISDATAAAPPSEAFVQTLEQEMQAAKSSEHLAAILAREGLLYDSEA